MFGATVQWIQVDGCTDSAKRGHWYKINWWKRMFAIQFPNTCGSNVNEICWSGLFSQQKFPGRRGPWSNLHWMWAEKNGYLSCHHVAIEHAQNGPEPHEVQGLKRKQQPVEQKTTVEGSQDTPRIANRGLQHSNKTQSQNLFRSFSLEKKKNFLWAKITQQNGLLAKGTDSFCRIPDNILQQHCTGERVQVWTTKPFLKLSFCRCDTLVCATKQRMSDVYHLWSCGAVMNNLAEADNGWYNKFPYSVVGLTEEKEDYLLLSTMQTIVHKLICKLFLLPCKRLESTDIPPVNAKYWLANWKSPKHFLANKCATLQ